MLHVSASALLASLLAVLVASALGAASTTFFVVGLLPIATGVAAGVGASIAHLALGHSPGRGAFLCACLGVLLGWLCFQAWDDHHLQSTWAQDLASAREVTTGMPASAGFDEDDVPFFAPDAAERLEEQVRELTGQSGALGRWMLRAESGVRLLGPWKQSRGLAVGPYGAWVWALLELLIAAWVAREVLRRVQPDESARETDDLDDDTRQDQGAA